MEGYSSQFVSPVVHLDPLVIEHLLKYFTAPHLNKILSRIATPPSFTTLRACFGTSRDELLYLLESHLRENYAETAHRMREIHQKYHSNISSNNNNNNNGSGSGESSSSTSKNGALVKSQSRTHSETIQEYELSIQKLKIPTPHPLLHDIVTFPIFGPFDFQPIYPHVYVDQPCGSSVILGANIFNVGIVGASSFITFGDKVSVFIDVDGVLLKGETKEIDEKGRKVFIGNGIALNGRTGFYSSKSGVGVQMTERVWNTPSLNNVLNGKLFLQHLPSLLCAHNLEVREGMTVLDMCAAPGGKTTHVGSLMNNKGKLFAFDKSKGKIKIIQKTCELQGLTIVESLALDSTKILSKTSEKENEKTTPSSSSSKSDRTFPPSFFERILLDPPCSGLGQRPRFSDMISIVEVQSAPSYQKKLLSVAVELLKPEGILVYSTCTINPEENEGVVSFALTTYPFMELLPPVLSLGECGLDGFGLSDAERKMCQRFDPSSDLNTIGFFIARFRKRQIT